ncbi:hypothetical protein AHAS_Ahas17G0160900 [Arachis hypogaea]
MRIKKKDGSDKWYVSRFVDEHNHELASGKFVDYLRSHRRISDVEIAQMTGMREVGISIPKIYESFTTQVGGFNLVTFTKQGMYNENAWKKRLLRQSSQMEIPRCEMLYVMYSPKPITGYVLGICFIMRPPIYVAHDSPSYLDTACLRTWRLTSSRAMGGDAG